MGLNGLKDMGKEIRETLSVKLASIEAVENDGQSDAGSSHLHTSPGLFGGSIRHRPTLWALAYI